MFGLIVWMCVCVWSWMSGNWWKYNVYKWQVANERETMKRRVREKSAAQQQQQQKTRPLWKGDFVPGVVENACTSTLTYGKARNLAHICAKWRNKPGIYAVGVWGKWENEWNTAKGCELSVEGNKPLEYSMCSMSWIPEFKLGFLCLCVLSPIHL